MNTPGVIGCPACLAAGVLPACGAGAASAELSRDWDSPGQTEFPPEPAADSLEQGLARMSRTSVPKIGITGNSCFPEIATESWEALFKNMLEESARQPAVVVVVVSRMGPTRLPIFLLFEILRQR